MTDFPAMCIRSWVLVLWSPRFSGLLRLFSYFSGVFLIWISNIFYIGNRSHNSSEMKAKTFDTGSHSFFRARNVHDRHANQRASSESVSEKFGTHAEVLSLGPIFQYKYIGNNLYQVILIYNLLIYQYYIKGLL